MASEEGLVARMQRLGIVWGPADAAELPGAAELWEFDDEWVEVDYAEPGVAAVIAAPGHGVDGFAPNATCIVWDLSGEVGELPELIAETVESAAIPGVEVIESASGDGPSEGGAQALRWHHAIIEVPEVGRVESNTRVEIGPRHGGDGARLIQRSSSILVGSGLTPPLSLPIGNGVFGR